MESNNTTSDPLAFNVQLDEGAFMPERAYPDDAGADIRTPRDFVITGRGFADIDSGVHIEIPKGYVGFLKSKSGLYINHGIISDGTIDAGYSDSVRVRLANLSAFPKTFHRGDKITQLVIQKVECVNFAEVDEIESGERGNNGIGSTGR